MTTKCPIFGTLLLENFRTLFVFNIQHLPWIVKFFLISLSFLLWCLASRRLRAGSLVILLILNNLLYLVIINVRVEVFHNLQTYFCQLLYFIVQY